MEKVKYTIITVCYNAEKYIRETIESLLCQTYMDYEYIIKDGGSTDKTLEIAHSLLDGKENIYIVSNPDKGIYDAMNQAVEMARGEYVYFLNAGDCFVNQNVLANVEVISSKRKSDILYGNIVQVEEKQRVIYKYGKVCKSKLYFSIGACICHQAMFVKRKLFDEKNFDTTYKVCADREWQLYQMKKKVVFTPMNFEVASVLVDGFSSVHVKELEEEIVECLEQYCTGTSWIYKTILKIKKNKLILRMLRTIEKIVSIKKQ